MGFDNHLALAGVLNSIFSEALCGILCISLRLALMYREINRRGESEVFAEDAESNFARALLW